MIITPIPAFKDNYIWVIAREHSCVVIDPGDAAPVLRYLKDRHLSVVAMLITHHHHDHVGGIIELRKSYDVPVFGPRAENIPLCSHPLDDGDIVSLPQIELSFSVFHVPGHTLGHIAYYAQPQNALFCGDTLFSSGCGRLFEGSPRQMHESLQRLASLPDNTRVYCTHEYTQANLRFAQHLEPENSAIAARIDAVNLLRAQQQPSLPSSMGLEKQVNPFLRLHSQALQQNLESYAEQKLTNDVERFAALRRWKDKF